MEEMMRNSFSFATDIWQFYKQHADVTGTDEYWAKVVADAEVLEQRYGKGNRHMHNILLEVIDALEEEEKKRNE